MKPIYCLFILITLGLSETTYSQTDTLLQGTWKFAYNRSFKKMDAELKVQFNDMSDSQRIIIENAYKGRKVIFNTDGSFLQTLKDGRSVEGSWKITKNEKKIEIKGPNGNIYRQKILKLNADQLVLKQENTGEGKLFFSEWHFTKN